MMIGVLTAPQLVSLKVSLIHALAIQLLTFLISVVQAQGSGPRTIASCTLEMSYLVEVLKDDQVSCAIESSVGDVQHKLTFIPIPKEDLHECVEPFVLYYSWRLIDFISQDLQLR